MLLSFALWVQALPFFTHVREGSWAYPIIMSLHMVGIAVFGGLILITDMRLLGWAMRGHSVSDVVDQLRWPKRIGLLFTATFGFLMFCCKAEEYYYNIFFRTKISLLVLVLVHAMIFRGSVYNNAAALDRSPQIPGRAKLAAALSLFLWISIACAGRGIGYIETPFGLHAQRIDSVIAQVLRR